MCYFTTPQTVPNHCLQLTFWLHHLWHPGRHQRTLISWSTLQYLLYGQKKLVNWACTDLKINPERIVSISGETLLPPGIIFLLETFRQGTAIPAVLWFDYLFILMSPHYREPFAIRNPTVLYFPWSLFNNATQFAARTSSAPVEVNYEGITAYITAVVLQQLNSSSCIDDTFIYLTHMCKARSTDIVQAQPFLAIAACVHVDSIAITQDSFYSNIRTAPIYPKLEPLLNIILEACGTPEGSFSFYGGWSGLDNAINAIYNHHHPSRQTGPIISRSTSPISFNGHDDNV